MLTDLATRAAAELELRRRRAERVRTGIGDIIKKCPEWSKDYWLPARFKAAYGGRASAKSHSFAEIMLARMTLDPDLQSVVVRKFRQSLTNSAQLLLKNKVDDLGLSAEFEVQSTQIKRQGGRGFIAFKGLQDHTAESVKSFENFGICWVEEATELDQRSLDMLIPTIRAPGSEVWFTWNPDQPEDPVDRFFRGDNPPKRAIIKAVSFRDNPFLSEESKEDEQRDLASDPEKHEWIWNGGYNVKSDAVIFSGRWRTGIIDTANWDGPYYGADWGFANDPTAAVEVWLSGNQVYISRESYSYRLEIDRTAKRWMQDIPGIEKHHIRADNSRPESINLVSRMGIPMVKGCEKWPGCVEDGIEWLRAQEIIIHPDCVNMQMEAKRYRYKQNRGGDVLPGIVDADNHLWDCVRYALQPRIQDRMAQIANRLAALS
jgi:phage terminase large subunit